MPRRGGAGQEAGPSLAEVLRLGLSVAAPRLPTHHWKILRALLACRTPALGGHRYQCQQCGRTHFVPHSCRNRHCPLCQGQAAHRWLEQQESALLPVPYFHLVFTLPHELNPLIRQNQRVLYRLLFAAASQTLLEFGQNRFGAQVGITAVLHTWSQTLLDHYHLHCIVTGGGLSRDGARWVAAQPLLPVPSDGALGGVPGQVLRRLCSSSMRTGSWSSTASWPRWAQRPNFQRLLRQATRRRWVVYAKRPFAGPQQVLAYLSRYTHRVAISPRRLLHLDAQDANRDLCLERLCRWGPIQDHDLGSRRVCAALLSAPVAHGLRQNPPLRLLEQSAATDARSPGPDAAPAGGADRLGCFGADLGRCR